MYVSSSLFATSDKVPQVREPVHVETLVLVKRHALDESTEMFSDAETFEVLGEGCLDTFIEG